MGYICTRHLENYGGRSYEAGDPISPVPGGNVHTWRAYLDMHWIVPDAETAVALGLTNIEEKIVQAIKRPGRPRLV